MTSTPFIRPTGAPSDKPFNTLGEIKTAMTNTGSHWWDKAALRFFSSRVSESVYPTPYGTFFVTSERDYPLPRRYTVRFIAATEVQTTVTYEHLGGPPATYTHERVDLVETSGDAFQRFGSASGAHSAAKRMQLAMLAVASEVAAHGRA